MSKLSLCPLSSLSGLPLVRSYSPPAQRQAQVLDDPRGVFQADFHVARDILVGGVDVIGIHRGGVGQRDAQAGAQLVVGGGRGGVGGASQHSVTARRQGQIAEVARDLGPEAGHRPYGRVAVVALDGLHDLQVDRGRSDVHVDVTVGRTSRPSWPTRLPRYPRCPRARHRQAPEETPTARLSASCRSPGGCRGHRGRR